MVVRTQEPTDAATPRAAPPASPWRPMRVATFRRLWAASVVSNVGTWMQNVAAVWLMTSLTTSATLVALVQTASALPTLALAVLAGALADVVDRRRLILVTQLWSLVAAVTLGGLALTGHVGPWSLLALTAAIGVGSALYVPASQAIVPELVERDDLPSAVALSGVAMNVARAVGPALGGVAVAAAGPGPVFLLNGASYLGVSGAVWTWRRERRAPPWPAERLVGALRAGVRYARHAPRLRAVLVRAGLFVGAASATWALLPVLARYQLGLRASGYGLLLGALGAGAVLGALSLARLRRWGGPDRLTIVGTVGYALGVVVLSVATGPAVAASVLVVVGFCWTLVMVSLNTAAQLAVPGWVRGRALGLYLTVFQGCMALGSAAWGGVAEALGPRGALLASAGGLALGAVGAVRWRLSVPAHDLRPSRHWRAPVSLAEPGPDDGPVLVTVEYRVAPEDVARFMEVARELEALRRRDGAVAWGVFRDLERDDALLETFTVDSWGEHLRQHHRVSHADQAVQRRAEALHRGEDPPVVRHLVTPRVRRRGRPE